MRFVSFAYLCQIRSELERSHIQRYCIKARHDARAQPVNETNPKMLSNMVDRPYDIPRRSTVLVTGANGFIASNVVDELLLLGFNVRGTIRDDKPWLDQMFEDKFRKNHRDRTRYPSGFRQSSPRCGGMYSYCIFVGSYSQTLADND